MPVKIATTFTLIVLILLLITGLWALTAYYNNLPEAVGPVRMILTI
jgi:Mg2+ and Co2+ transporter CorA